jgi:hypothetical protein
MRIAIYQPQYFPRLHYFHRALASDVFALMVNAQDPRRLVHQVAGQRVAQPAYQSQAPIKSPSGSQLLRVPISGSRRRPICCTDVAYTDDWRARQLRTIEVCYRRARYFDDYFPEIASLLGDSPASLADLSVRTFLWGLTRLLGADVPVSDLSIAAGNDVLTRSGIRLQRVVLAHELACRPDGPRRGTEWTVAICKAASASEYLHGGTARANYMDLDAYRAAGVQPIEQSWACREYRQLYTSTAGFVPNLSIIDLLLNVGPDEGRDFVLDHELRVSIQPAN